MDNGGEVCWPQLWTGGGARSAMNKVDVAMEAGTKAYLMRSQGGLWKKMSH